MSDSITIELSGPITKPGQGDDNKLTQIVMREPKYLDIMTLGEPSAFASHNGMVYTADKDDTIKAYVERLAQDADGKAIDPLLLRQLNARDTFKLRDAVFSFFNAARQTTT